ncbi:MAG: HEAT repeat domain-containing protein [Planctomycetaceae bacterium]
MTRFLTVACCWSLLWSASLAAEPQTGPETEKRFPPLKVPAGFKATLFACDPLIEYPSAIALGPRANTLFVAVDYMTGLGTTDIILRDEIRLVEDTDGDDYADRAPIWADGFNSIQGLTYHDGTVFVMHTPYLTALRDIDGDGVADERKNLFKGFGLGPEEDKVRLHNANGLVAGHDGWLYLALGDRGCDVTRPEGDLLVLNGGGILRCRPDGRDLHVFSTGLRNIYDERPDEALAPLADLGLGSSAGGVYYREPQFPAEYRGLYFCEWGRAVMRYVAESPGNAFSPVKEIEFASGAENDPYGFKPTDLVVDRDGSLLIADWADGQRPKRGRARVYRVQFVGQDSNVPMKNGQVENVPHDVAGWTKRLSSGSYYERLEAQLAIERLGRGDPIAAIKSLRNEYENLSAVGKQHCVWILTHVLGTQATDDLFDLAGSTSDRRLQTQAIRALADLHDPVLVGHRLDAGPGDVNVVKRLMGLVGRRNHHLTLEIVVAIGRMNSAQAPVWMSQNLALMDPVLAHATQQTLRRCGDRLAVLRLLDGRSPEPPALIDKNIDKKLMSDFTKKLKGDLEQKPLPSVSLRTAALRALKDQPEAAIVDGLVDRLRSERDSIRRLEYAYVLCRVHRKPPTQWVYWGFRPAPRPANTVAWERTELIEQALDRMLADENHDVRLAVLERMQREKIPTRLATLAAWLRETDHPEAQALILTSLRDHPAEARRETLETFLTETRQLAPSRIKALAMWCEGLGEERERRLLALAPSLANDPLLADLLRALSQRSESDTRLKSEVSPEVITLLLSSARSPNGAAAGRAAAIEVMASLRIADVVSSVPGLLNDASPEVRLAAAFAAGQLGVCEAVPTLLDRVRTDFPEMKRASLDALRQLREPRVLPLAVAALGDATTQLSALRCLDEFGGPEHSADVVKVATGNSSGEVLSLVVRMLSKWADRESLDEARRAELERAMNELQGTRGVLLRWKVQGPMSADEAAKCVESLRMPNNSASWRTIFGTGPEARVSDVATGGSPVATVWLAFADFHSAEPVAAQFLMSSNTPLRVWLNGKSVLERKEARRFQPDADRFETELANGTSRLLVQLANVPDALPEFHARFRQKSSKVEHERLVEAALSRAGNVERGQKLFLTVAKSQCLKCHRRNDQGEKIGPDLTGIGSRFSRIHIIESVLDPSRTIAAGFQSQTVAINDGRILSGLKVSETVETLVLADNQGQKHSLRKADIEESQMHLGSTMPDGLEKTLTVEEFVDLIAFLTSEKQSAGR